MPTHRFVLRAPWAPPSQLSEMSGFPMLQPPLPPQPPTPPVPIRLKTLEEMASPVQLIDELPPAKRGLFWDLLGGDHHALTADILEHPANYDPGLVSLAEDLLEGRRKMEDLTREEQHLLNRGTVDFAQFRTTAQTTKAPPPPPRKMRPSDETKVTEPPPIPEPSVDVPETPGGMRPYWWL
jgi:hypothetical protein